MMRPRVAWILVATLESSACCLRDGAEVDIICTYEDDGEVVVYDEVSISCDAWASYGAQAVEGLRTECEYGSDPERDGVCLCDAATPITCQCRSLDD